MTDREQALKDFNDNIHHSNIDYDVYHVKGISFDTVQTIRKALEAKEPEVVSIDDVICECGDIEYYGGRDLLKQSCKLLSAQYPNGIIIKGDE